MQKHSSAPSPTCNLAYSWWKLTHSWVTVGPSGPYGFHNPIDLLSSSCTFFKQISPTMHNPFTIAFLAVSLRHLWFSQVSPENKRRAWAIWHVKPNSALFFPCSCTENTPLASKMQERLLCVGDRLVHGCSILSFAPLSINLPCLSHRFDRCGTLSFMVWTQVLFKLFKGLKPSLFWLSSSQPHYSHVFAVASIQELMTVKFIEAKLCK